MVDVTLELETITEEYAIYRLKSVGANIKRKTKTEERTVWATLEASDEEAFRITVPLKEEAEIPEGATSLDTIRATLVQVYFRLDAALNDIENSPQGDW